MHASLGEIADQLFLSRTTVKPHALSLQFLVVCWWFFLVSVFFSAAGSKSTQQRHDQLDRRAART